MGYNQCSTQIGLCRKEVDGRKRGVGSGAVLGNVLENGRRPDRREIIGMQAHVDGSEMGAEQQTS